MHGRSNAYIDAGAIGAARTRVEDSLRTKLKWATWQADAEADASIAMANVDRVMTDANLKAMASQALVNDGHCPPNAPATAIAALVFEQVYLARLTNTVQEKGDFWGGKNSVPSQRCKWSRAAALFTAAHLDALVRDGLCVIDDALTPAEARAARLEIAELDRAGQLEEVACQSKARVRNDRIGWVSQESVRSLPAIGVAMRLLRALPAEVERGAAQRSVADAGSSAPAEAGEGAQLAAANNASYWQMAVPTLCMAAVYAGSTSKPTFYCRHYDGGTPGTADAQRNPRRLVRTPPAVPELCSACAWRPRPQLVASADTVPTRSSRCILHRHASAT
mgnify:CR=1 FL=1